MTKARIASVRAPVAATLDRDPVTISTSDPNQVVDSWSTTEYRSVKYVLQVTSGTDYQVSELLVIHDGSTAYVTEYAVVQTAGSLAAFTVDVNSGNVRLLVDLAGSSATIKLNRSVISV